MISNQVAKKIYALFILLHDMISGLAQKLMGLDSVCNFWILVQFQYEIKWLLLCEMSYIQFKIFRYLFILGCTRTHYFHTWY